MTADAENVRVLLCDDSAQLRALVRRDLVGDPVITVVAETADGREAIALAAANDLDVIVLDLHMPGPEPADLVRRLRRAAPGAAIVTYSGIDPRTIEGLDAGTVYHVPKVSDLPVLRRAVRRLGAARVP